MANGTIPTLEILVDIPNEQVAQIVSQFKAVGFTVVKIARQADGDWSLAAAK